MTMPKWKKKPYEKENLAGHIYPISQMGKLTLDDGTEGQIAWLPKPFVLVVDLPDKKAEYRLDINALVLDLECQISEEKAKWVWRDDDAALCACSACGEESEYDDCPFCPYCGHPMEVME